MQERMYQFEVEKENEELRNLMAARDAELNQQRRTLYVREKELDSLRMQLMNDYSEREASFLLGLEKRETQFVEREQEFIVRKREFEKSLMQRDKDAAEVRDQLMLENVERELELKRIRVELDKKMELYKYESREKMEQTSKTYVDEAIKTLEEKEKKYQDISKYWSYSGVASLVVGFLFFSFVTVYYANNLSFSVTWSFLVFTVFKGSVAVAILAGLARYAFIFSNSYMQEALKNADRRHAINFGKFYLESFGAAADWSQVKEAFEHWNITGSNGFASLTKSSIDIDSLEKVVSIIGHSNKPYKNDS